MSNLDLYNKARQVPTEALKDIKGGRLKGMSNINPQWRIEKLTELFGVCGIGWYYEICDKWLDTTNDEIIANVCIKLYISLNKGEWSKPILGIGANKLIEKESGGLHNNDEAYKMATTDALSVACKQLGIGADVYFKYDKTKYDIEEPKQEKSEESPNSPKVVQEKSESPKDDKWEEIDRILKLEKTKDGRTISKYFKLLKIGETVALKTDEMINDFEKHFGYKQVNNAPIEEFNEFIKEWYLNKFAPKKEEEIKYKDIDFDKELDGLPVEYAEDELDFTI